MKFYISDLHFGHKKSLAFDNRPFSSLEEMEYTLISNWNSRIGKNDEVYILGDMFWYNANAPKILAELKGRKYLILGNHDRVNTEMAKHFIWCDKRLEYIKDEGQKIVYGAQHDGGFRVEHILPGQSQKGKQVVDYAVGIQQHLPSVGPKQEVHPHG